MKLAVITDSSAAISEKYKHFDNLHILDIPLAVDGVSYRSTDISDEDYFKLMTNSKEVPKTAQPKIVELEELLRRLESQGYTHVLGLFLTSGISGFYQNVFYLEKEFSDMVVKIPETFITSSPLGYMVDTALESAKRGLSFEEVLANFEKQRDGDSAFMLIDDLKWLSKSGRLSNGSAILGTLLSIKPVLTFSADGKVEVYEKVRTIKKTMSRMKELLLENSNPEDYKLYVIHALAEDKAQELYEYAQSQNYKDLEIVTFGPVIATHLGTGSVAYAMTPKVFTDD